MHSSQDGGRWVGLMEVSEVPSDQELCIDSAFVASLLITLGRMGSIESIPRNWPLPSSVCQPAGRRIARGGLGLSVRSISTCSIHIAQNQDGGVALAAMGHSNVLWVAERFLADLIRLVRINALRSCPSPARSYRCLSALGAVGLAAT